MSSLSFIVPTEEHAQLILDWRTRPDIASQMLTEVPYDVERQKAWLRRCAGRTDYVHRLLCVDGVPVGHVSITVTEPAWKIATIGVLTGERAGRMGAAPLNFAYMLNHVFFTMGLRKVVNHILGTNSPRLLKGQPMLGYRPVGVLSRQVVKDGREIDLHIFEMLAEDWRTVRGRFAIYEDMDGRRWE
ncbi:GNAT family N-acetyltransferase [Azospirillum thermophilum]|uniref:GNAT family N-acetyltransferase n=1 Tax=Azospirillum thermophilum TaxID=2202148 RepID=A0A2S2D0Q9_9PROT|nr:GNAT family N-acetyltransferase [Azospirillum thermophilum]AWK90230.1 GNAT family N-acetyltransferase [Azospirillum thermophilum]